MPLANIVRLEVGRNSSVRVVNVDKDVLQFYSGYFRAALSGGFAEAMQRVIKLPTEELAVVELAVTWMLRRQLNVDFKSPAKGDTGLLLCKLWTFADRRDMPMLANVTIDHLRSHLFKQWYPPTRQMVQFSYANTTEDAALRRFLAFFMVVTCSPRSLRQKTNHGWPHEATLDLLEAVYEGKDHGVHRSGVDPTGTLRQEIVQTANMCEYHVHGKGVTCKVAKQEGCECGCDF